MATVETKIKGMEIEHPKPKTSLCLCCFGSFHSKIPTTGSEHKAKQKSGSSSWFPWQMIRFRVKNSMAKTVPLEGSKFDEIVKLKLKLKANKVYSSRWKWKSKSKSDLLSKSQSNSKPNQTPSMSQGKQKQLQNPERYNPVVAVASVVVITLVSVIVWGRLCSIICTTAWLYLIPHLWYTAQNDKQDSISVSNDLILDSNISHDVAISL